MTIQAHPPVKTDQEVADRLSKLPEFSQKVYKTIQEYLKTYEPFFSDLMVDDIAKMLEVKSQAVSGALVHLTSQGLVHMEEHRANFRTRYFVHTYEHDEYSTY